MKLLAFSVYDKKVEAFTPVFFVRAKGEAIRHFMTLCSDGKSLFWKYPLDYDLVLLSEFDDQDGCFSSEDNWPLVVMTGLDAKAAASSE